MGDVSLSETVAASPSKRPVSMVRASEAGSVPPAIPGQSPLRHRHRRSVASFSESMHGRQSSISSIVVDSQASPIAPSSPNPARTLMSAAPIVDTPTIPPPSSSRGLASPLSSPSPATASTPSLQTKQYRFEEEPFEWATVAPLQPARNASRTTLASIHQESTPVIPSSPSPKRKSAAARLQTIRTANMSPLPLNASPRRSSPLATEFPQTPRSASAHLDIRQAPPLLRPSLTLEQVAANVVTSPTRSSFGLALDTPSSTQQIQASSHTPRTPYQHPTPSMTSVWLDGETGSASPATKTPRGASLGRSSSTRGPARPSAKARTAMHRKSASFGQATLFDSGEKLRPTASALPTSKRSSVVISTPTLINSSNQQLDTAKNLTDSKERAELVSAHSKGAPGSVVSKAHHSSSSQRTSEPETASKINGAVSSNKQRPKSAKVVTSTATHSQMHSRTMSVGREPVSRTLDDTKKEQKPGFLRRLFGLNSKKPEPPAASLPRSTSMQPPRSTAMPAPATSRQQVNTPSTPAPKDHRRWSLNPNRRSYLQSMDNAHAQTPRASLDIKRVMTAPKPSVVASPVAPSRPARSPLRAISNTQQPSSGHTYSLVSLDSGSDSQGAVSSHSQNSNELVTPISLELPNVVVQGEQPFWIDQQAYDEKHEISTELTGNQRQQHAWI